MGKYELFLKDMWSLLPERSLMVVNLFHVIDGNDLFLFIFIFVVILFICYIVCPPWWCFFSKGVRIAVV